ncbi:MAG: SDR family oxidoreductase [Nannocystaceae bacterium]
MPADQTPTPSEKPTILVTGACGAMARLVIARLHRQANIIAVDFRRKPSFPGFSGADIPSYKIDFNRRASEDVFRNHPISGVIHLGRLTPTRSSRNRRYHANILGTQKLYALCTKYKVNRIVVLSTYYVYGASPYNPAMLSERAPLKAAELTHELVNSVELENLTQISLWRKPELGITILRPCNIIGPGVRNTISRLLSQRYAPCLAGFSPMMQFIHVEDMADAIVCAFGQPHRGIFNVAPDDWVAFHDALKLCGATPVPLPSIPALVPQLLSHLLENRGFPRHLVNYFKYSVIIDGALFRKTFGFTPQRQIGDAFAHYRQA